MKQGGKHKAQSTKLRARRRAAASIVACALCFGLCAFAFADTITFTGSAIPLRSCTIQAVQGGQVFYSDPSGQRQRRPLEQIAALGFDGLPDLDQAEAALAQDDFDAGLRALLRSLVKAESDLQRLWIRARLSQAHDLHGEYVQAAGHAALVFAQSDDVSWKSLRPVSQVNKPSYAAAREAVDNLQAAIKRIKSAELRNEAEAMLRAVQPIADELAKEYAGPPIDSGSTLSGFPKSEIVAEKPIARPPALSAAPKPPVAAPPATQSSTPIVAASPSALDPRSPEAIEQMLTAGKAAEAVAVCVEIAKNPGERDLAHFLHQYGRALSRAGQPEDAAVMLTRCAVLYPESPDAGLALMETAVIYRDHYHRPEIARRLLQKVIADAEAGDQPTTAMLARELLTGL